jgi:DNA-binding NtrC family response regulator
MGAVLTTFMKYLEDIETVFLFTTKTKDIKDQMYKEYADMTEKVMKQNKKNIILSMAELDFYPSPIDYKLVYHEMKAKLTELMDKNNILNDQKIINISSGTPTMTTCWILLQQSGIIPNAKLVQAYPREYQKKTKEPVDEVDFKIQGFPEIKNRDVLKEQLDNNLVKVEKLKEQLTARDIHNKFPAMIGRSPKMKKVKEDILRLAPTDNNVLIIGEPGTGKELVATYIQENSKRAGLDFLKINIGGKSSGIIDSELFGHKKGSFTGASRDRLGYFRANKGGTIFIDEIGDAPLDIQEKLLRAIEYGEITPVGEEITYKVNVRIISATNQDIKQKVEEGKFRQDLLSRLGQLIKIPPLRERLNDIEEIIETKYYDLNLSDECKEHLLKEPWDGANVRELLTTLDSAKSLNQSEPIERDDIPSTAMDLLLEKKSGIPLPNLPLPLPLVSKKEFDYNHAIIRKARSMTNKRIEVDRLLCQPVGTEKARINRKNNG